MPNYSLNTYCPDDGPLANSTPTPNSNSSCIVYNRIYNNINLTEIKLSKDREDSSKSSRKATTKKTVGKKPLVAKKTTTNAIKPSVNYINGVKSVERILSQINMTKYSNLFKNYTVEKFINLNELDLNALGITRPQELRTLKDAINRAKYEYK